MNSTITAINSFGEGFGISFPNALAGFVGGACYPLAVFFVFLKARNAEFAKAGAPTRENRQLSNQMFQWFLRDLPLFVIAAVLGFCVAGYLTSMIAKKLFAPDLPPVSIAFAIGVSAVKIVLWINKNVSLNLKNGNGDAPDLNEGPRLFN